MSGTIVTTTMGDIPETDLDITMVPQESNEQMWIMARECRYKGSNPELVAHVGEIVRRDVWATIKCGHSVTGQQGA